MARSRHLAGPGLVPVPVPPPGGSALPDGRLSRPRDGRGPGHGPGRPEGDHGPAGQPAQPPWHPPGALAEQGQPRGHQDPPHHRRVEQHRDGEARRRASSAAMIDSVAKTEKTATMITAALVITPALLAMPPTTACAVVAPRAAQLADPAQQEHVVVHAEPEQEHEEEQRDPRHDRPVAGEVQRRPAGARPGRSSVTSPKAAPTDSRFSPTETRGIASDRKATSSRPKASRATTARASGGRPRRSRGVARGSPRFPRSPRSSPLHPPIVSGRNVLAQIEQGLAQTPSSLAVARERHVHHQGATVADDADGDRLGPGWRRAPRPESLFSAGRPSGPGRSRLRGPAMVTAGTPAGSGRCGLDDRQAGREAAVGRVAEPHAPRRPAPPARSCQPRRGCPTQRAPCITCRTSPAHSRDGLRSGPALAEERDPASVGPAAQHRQQRGQERQRARHGGADHRDRAQADAGEHRVAGEEKAGERDHHRHAGFTMARPEVAAASAAPRSVWPRTRSSRSRRR